MGYVAILLADGFEEVEALLPCDFLRRADIPVKLVSITDNEQVEGSHGIKVVCDLHLADIQHSDISAVIVPGGMPGSTKLAENSAVIDCLNHVYTNNKWVAGICASPTVVLSKTNFFAGKYFTCTPSQRDKTEHRSFYKEEDVVIDGYMITSRGPGTTAAFTHAIITKLASKEIADNLFTRALFTL
ncbi:DJ-1/PfpI family protein [Entomospira entomophila]|uniref:DJ-1/PfpI family protein n=1 Tax=Entomospira entomophila TaxID=2719988 RepID=A0A968KVM8_9SPIO|nr:DJ-1 family glyoxalase III [Entomospira entomophilus]NIZ40005.1 DJ-1/PfpI family protein [Entomospira entomophilus]WDI35565.1 DJ-1/PfpI family protein [Entomospira entomophilus]